MARSWPYTLLCGLVGGFWLVGGLGLLGGYLAYHMPGGVGLPLFGLGPGGHYVAAAAGCALLVWGGLLLAAARQPAQLRVVGTFTVLGLVLSGLYRMHAWLIGDYAEVGHLLRGEAAVFLLLALAFLWLRPKPVPA